MKTFGRFLFAIALLAGAGSAAKAQPSPQAIPDGPFKTVHLLIVAPSQEATLTAAVNDFNRGFAQDGCPSCAYRVFRMVSGNNGKYTYMMEGEWPGRDAYVKVHASAAFEAANKRNPIISDLSATEFYGRYVEVK